MGMSSYICKGCGHELCERELVRLNGNVQEYDGYGGSEDHNSVKAWHERCYQHAPDNAKLNDDQSEHAPNQGFGPQKLEAMTDFDPSADTRYSVVIDAMDEDDKRCTFYLTKRQWNHLFENEKEYERVAERIGESKEIPEEIWDGPQKELDEFIKNFDEELKKEIEEEVGYSRPSTRILYLNSLEEALQESAKVVGALPLSIECYTLWVYGKQKNAEGAVYEKTISKYDARMTRLFGGKSHDVEDGTIVTEIQDWTNLVGQFSGRTPVYDKFDKEIVNGNFLDVDKVGIHRVFDYKGELCFTPYGKVQTVRSYFKNSIYIADPPEIDEKYLSEN